MRVDVPLIQAQFCWNDEDEGSGAGVVRYEEPMSATQRRRAALYENATGACFSHWGGLSADGRMVELLRDAFMAVKRDGADINSVFDALITVPEFRAILHSGDLPEEYRVAESS